MNLDLVMQDVAYRQLAGPPPSVVDVTGVTSDSRKVAPGTLFVAVRGGAADGHAFVGDALSRGAAALALEDAARAPAEGGAVATLEVEDGRAALARASANLAGRPAERLRLVGVTGTNGKTTVTWILEAIAAAAGRTPGLVGTVLFRVAGAPLAATHTTPGPEILQPLLARMVEAGCELAILEVSSHALDQRRVEACSFEVAIFTGLGRDHLDYHGDLETYFEAKASLFERHLSPSATAVIAVDGAHGRRLRRRLEASGVRVIATTLAPPGGDAGVAWVSEPRLSLDGIEARLHLPGGPEEGIKVRSPMVGRHNLANLLSAAAAAGVLGIDAGAIARGISTFEGAPGRLQRVPDPRGEGRRAFVDYAHTPDAIEGVVGTLRALAPEGARLVVVFGCGGDRDQGKRPLMGQAASGADVVVVTSDNPRSEAPGAIIEAILPGVARGVDTHVEPDREAALRLAAGLCGAGDVLLVAGKGHERTQEVAGELRPFDDVEVLARALEDVGAGTQGGRAGA